MKQSALDIQKRVQRFATFAVWFWQTGDAAKAYEIAGYGNQNSLEEIITLYNSMDWPEKPSQEKPAEVLSLLFEELKPAEIVTIVAQNVRNQDSNPLLREILNLLLDYQRQQAIDRFLQVDTDQAFSELMQDTDAIKTLALMLQANHASQGISRESFWREMRETQGVETLKKAKSMINNVLTIPDNNIN